MPYLVMEHVEGVPIDRYCDDLRLGLDARLRLFLTVCDAVSHAHRSLVVHRDIKPNNILVTREGVPKLLDFGIARLTLDGVSDPSAPGPPRMMTPFYASPEVVRGEQVTTSADVYALGVLLYELLTGARPLRFMTMTSAEVERVVCHVDPRRPSHAAHDQDVHDHPPAERAARRRTTPERLSARLAGDLDAIINMALQKDPARRYASVEALAADVRAHLEQRPVAARTPTWHYVAGRFVARNRWAVTAAAVLLTVVTAAAAGLSVQARRLAEQSSRTAQERDTTREVPDFLTQLFEVSNPDQSPDGSAITARELLDRGAERIDAELGGRPLVQARLLATIGGVYRSLGAYTQSAGLLERALALRRASLGTAHPETADAMDALAESYRELARLEEAEAMHREALGVRRRAGVAPALVASSLNNLGITLSDRGRYTDAEPLLREAVDIWRAGGSDTEEDLATGLNNLAAVLRHQGRLDDAVPLLDEAVAIRRQRFGNTHPALASVLGHLGQVYNLQGALDKAEPLLRQALEIRQRAYGDDHPDTATARNNLSSLLHDQGRLAAAEPLYQTTLAGVEKRLGTRHPDYAIQLNNLASLLEDWHRLDEAERLYRQSLDIRRQTYGESHAAVARTEHNLGRTLLARGRVAEAAALARTALATRERLLGVAHYETALSRMLVGETLAAQGQAADAEQLLLAALESMRGSLGRDHPNVADCLLKLSTFHRRARQPVKAAPFAQEAVEIRRAKLPAAHWKRAVAEIEWAAVLVDLARPAEAASLLRPAVGQLAAGLGERDDRVTAARALLATVGS
jgi:serine/threonine-protein kinase